MGRDLSHFNGSGQPPQKDQVSWVIRYTYVYIYIIYYIIQIIFHHPASPPFKAQRESELEMLNASMEAADFNLLGFANT